jgi:hypothetical protein
MDDVTEKETFKEWKNYIVSKGFITPLWDREYEDFHWIETFMTDEIPKNDIWNTSATVTKLTSILDGSFATVAGYLGCPAV